MDLRLFVVTRFALRTILACLALAIATPGFADNDDHEWHGKRRHGQHRHHHHEPYRDAYWNSPCRVEGWYNHHGRYRERRVCQESHVRIPAPAVLLAPPAIVIQAPGIYLR